MVSIVADFRERAESRLDRSLVYLNYMPKLIDLTGQRFDRLVVIERADVNKGRKPAWTCLCDCGQTLETTGDSLKSGATRSCGCYRRETSSELCKSRSKHDDTRSTEWYVWQGIRQRCQNSRSRDYSHYGERGIKVCDRWQSYESFLADMGRRPSSKHSLDRIDVDGDYEPSNCRWATQREQQNNRRNNRLIEWQGETRTASEWARELGIKKDTFLKRLRRHGPCERAFKRERLNRWSV